MRKFIGLSFAFALTVFSMGAKADQTVQSIGDAFVANLPSGWNATVGSWVYFDTLGCFTTPGYTCYGDNPSSPYGSPYFGEYGANPNLATLQLDEDEAIVVIFRTPPEMRYYSFNQYLYKRADSSTEIFGSLGEALNLKELGTTGSSEPGASPFDSYAAVVWTADQNTYNSVQEDLLASGLPWQAINYLPLPQVIPATSLDPEYDLQMGHASSADVFNLLMRTAMPSDQAAFDAYVAENPYYVIRVGPTAHLAANPSPVVGYPSDISGITEGSDQQKALNRLVSDIKNHYAGTFSLRKQTSTYTTHTGWNCITELSECTGDNYDSLYSHDTAIVRVKSLQDFVIVVGVNHQETGKATYANFAVYDSKKLASIVSITDSDLTKQSAFYHAGVTNPRDPRVKQYQDLYAYMFSYDCAGKQYCTAIPPPTESDPVGLQPGAPFFVLGRSYMEPHTLVRPSGAEVVHHQVFIGTRK
ncbi:MAG TPA: hypothetical protein VGK80_05800 [Rhodanobacteraceae bacterium]